MQARLQILPKKLLVRWLSILVIGTALLTVACFLGCSRKKSRRRSGVPPGPVASCRADAGVLTALPRVNLDPEAAGFSEANSRAWIRALTAPGLGGRPAGSPHSLRLARLLARRLEAFGLRGGAPGNRFCQPYPLKGRWDQNVVARRPSRPPGGPLIIVGAHYDSLGLEAGKPHPGADDNASGVAALMEVARLLARGAAPRAEVLLIAFGGEELGLLGSKHFVAHAAGELRRARLMINLDMVGRQLLEGQTVRALLGDPSDTIGYVLSERGERWTGPLLAAVSKRLGIRVVGIPEALLKMAGFLSDSVPFSPHVPTIFFSTSLHDDYAQLTDTPDKIDHGQIRRTAALVLGVLERKSALP